MIRHYTIAFGNMFNDLTVERKNNKTGDVQTIGVPLAYGPKEKWLVRLRQDPDLDRPAAIQLPRMGFELNSIEYDSSRKLSTSQRQRKPSTSDANKHLYQYMPVPYNLNFTLNIMVKNANDGVAIVEQILPFFTPEWTFQVQTIPEMSLVKDIPLVLNSVSNEDTYEQGFEERRALIWTLDFTMKAYIYGPIHDASVIKKSLINFAVVANNGSLMVTDSDINNTDIVSTVKTIPGVNANGEPTTDYSTALDNYQDVQEEDDFGFAQDVDVYPYGKRFNPDTGEYE